MFGADSGNNEDSWASNAKIDIFSSTLARQNGGLLRMGIGSDKLRLDYLQEELELSMTFVRLAERAHQSGRRRDGRRILRHAATGYSAVFGFIWDPDRSHLRHLELCEISEGMRRLGDALRRLSPIV